MKISNYIIAIILLSLLSYAAIAQNKQGRKYYLPGDTIADHTFTDLVNYPKKSVSIKNFRGKWLILDLWSVGCAACIRSFPRMDTLAEQFKDKVQVMMVGLGGLGPKYDPRLKAIYEKMKNRYNLTLTFAFDTVLRKKYDIASVPYILIINPDGILEYKTDKIDAVHLKQIINGEKVKLKPAFAASEPNAADEYNPQIPLLTSGAEANGGIDTNFLFRSLLTTATEEMPFLGDVDFLKRKADVSKGRIDVVRVSTEKLYLLANFGTNDWTYYGDVNYEKLYPHLIWKSKKVHDKSARWAYSLTVPKNVATPNFLTKVMQRDLENYFGVTARVAEMEVPVYYLEIADKEKASKMIKQGNGGALDMKMNEAHFYYENAPISNFCLFLLWRLRLDNPVFNNTGMSKVTFDFIATVGDSSSIRDNLENYGLKLVKGVKMMKAVIIEDL